MIPVFIGGCPRSGTTLLGALLGAPEHCLAVPESQFKIEFLKNRNNKKNSSDIRESLQKKMQNQRSHNWWCISKKPGLFSGFKADASYKELIIHAIKTYGEYVGKKDCIYWIDHTPSNKNYLHTLRSIFPNSKAIHLIRDGRAVAASILNRDWGPNSIIGAAHWWMEHVSLGLAAENGLGKDYILRVRYEELVSQPERSLKRICSWLDIDYHPEMAKGGGFKAPALTVKRNPQVMHKPDPEFAYAWEQKLTTRQIEIFESETMEFLSYLGYPLKFGLRAKKANMPLIASSMMKELYTGPLNILRFRYQTHLSRRKKQKR
jgi:hypothetical protein